MFNSRFIEKVEDKLETHIQDDYDYRKAIHADLKVLDERISKLSEVLIKVNSDTENREEGIMIEVQKQLLTFHREIMDTVLSSIEKIMRDHREISLIEALAKNVKDEDLGKLRISLMQPIIEARNAQELSKKVESIENNVKSLGNKIFDKKRELEQQYLEMNRKKQDTKEVEHKLEIINWVTGLK